MAEQEHTNTPTLADIPPNLAWEINPLIADNPIDTLARLEAVMAFLSVSTKSESLDYVNADEGLGSVIEVCLHTLQHARMKLVEVQS